jgi:hypothetical protein
MTRFHQIVWLGKFAVTALSALLLCISITPLVGVPLGNQPLNTASEAPPELIAYATKPTPRYVIVGTSLSRRLKSEFFLPLEVQNLAIPGRSSSTGLEIITSYPTLPPLIFIETNVMQWDIDKEFAANFSYKSRPEFHIARPIRSLIDYFAAPRTRTKANRQQQTVDEAILAKPPAEYDNKVYVERAMKDWSGNAADVVIKSNVEFLSRMVDAVEARGSKVYFFELPLAPGMADTDQAKTTRGEFRKKYSDPSRWLVPRYQVDQLRFGDHAHLDERSALIVARAMLSEIVLLHSQSLSK